MIVDFLLVRVVVVWVPRLCSLCCVVGVLIQTVCRRRFRLLPIALIGPIVSDLVTKKNKSNLYRSPRVHLSHVSLPDPVGILDFIASFSGLLDSLRVVYFLAAIDLIQKKSETSDASARPTIDLFCGRDIASLAIDGNRLTSDILCGPARDRANFFFGPSFSLVKKKTGDVHARRTYISIKKKKTNYFVRFASPSRCRVFPASYISVVSYFS
jgi:hypothetical protein